MDQQARLEEEEDSIGHTLLRAAVQLGSHNTGAFLRRRRFALVQYLQGLRCTCSAAAPLLSARLGEWRPPNQIGCTRSIPPPQSHI